MVVHLQYMSRYFWSLVLNEAIQTSMNINMFLNVSVFMGKIIGMVKWGKTPV